jgi:hypothetical protein
MKIGGAAPPPRLTPPAPRRTRAPDGRSFVEVLGEMAGARAGPGALPMRRLPPAPKAAAVAVPGAGASLSRGLARALAKAAAGEARVDAILDAAARGKTFTPAELLAVQATVFRYSQTIEVLSRATDRLVGAVKQTLGTQV